MTGAFAVIVFFGTGVYLAGCIADKSETSDTQDGVSYEEDSEISAVSETGLAPSFPAHFPFDPIRGPQSSLFDCTNPSVPDELYAVAPTTCIADNECSIPLVVGHRGAGGEFGQIAPENSLASIRAALWMGLDGVELDVRHTSDDVVVLMHDTTLDRTTHTTGPVSEASSKTLASLKLRFEPVGMDVSSNADFECETVPTLSEALALIDGRMFVDLDTKTDRVDLVVATIVEAGARDWVYISVSDPQRAVQARSIDPQVRIQVRPNTPDELTTVLGLFVERPPEIIEIPSDRIPSMAETIKTVGAKIFVDAFGEDAVARLAGVEKSNYIKLFNEGTHVVQSEFPGAVLRELDRNPPHSRL